MKKGFTLIEMIVIMVIFMIIALMSFPAIDGMIQKGKEDKKNLFLNDVFLATEAYIQKYSDNYPTLNNNDFIFVYMDELVTENLVKSTLVNPLYCDNTGCRAKQISTCVSHQCTIDPYTIIVYKNSEGILNYLLVEKKKINKVCIKNSNCTVDSSTAVVELTEKGLYKLDEE